MRVIIASVQPSDLPGIQKIFMGRWQLTRKCLKLMSITEEELFDKFLAENYFSVFEEVVRSRQFVPKFAEDHDDVAQSVITTRRSLTSKLLPSAVSDIDACIAEMWRAELSGLSVSMRACVSEKAFESFEKTKYYDAVESVAMSLAVSGAGEAVVHPKVQIQEQASPAEQALQRSMLECFTADVSSTLDEAVQEGWLQEVQKMSQEMQEHLPREAPETYWQQVYYPMMQQVLA